MLFEDQRQVPAGTSRTKFKSHLFLPAWHPHEGTIIFRDQL